MNIVEHFLIGWVVAGASPIERRDRAIVTAASAIADLDGFGAVPEMLTRGTSHEIYWWTDYHHTFCHNVTFAICVAIAAFVVSRRKLLTSALAFLTFHLHLLGDIVGARGPDGYDWPIPYLMPFRDDVLLSWSGQWALNAWQNEVITAICVVATLWIAWRRGVTPLEMFWKRGDRAVVDALRQRFGGAQTFTAS